MKILIVFIFLCAWSFVSPLYCYWNTGCSYKYFGTKTAYDSIRGDIRDSLIQIKECKPISLWSIARHGDINPGPVFGRQMQEALNLKDLVITSHEKKASSLCTQDIDNLKDCTTNKDKLTKDFYLTDQGYQDMFGIGKRLAQALPELLTSLRDNSRHSFQAAKEEYIENSLKAFLEGLTGSKNGGMIKMNQSKLDIIAPHMKCEKSQRETINNTASFKEVEVYKQSLEFLATIDRIKRRTGINYDLSSDNVTALYDLCRYTQSAPEKNSPWCAVFTTDDLKALEYVDDLRHYYKNGYGNPTHSKYAGPVLWDLLKSFQLAKDTEGKNIVSYVSDATIMDMIYSTLGLFKSEHSLNGKERMMQRKWRVSYHTGLSANFVAVLSRCNGHKEKDYTIVFYLNEQPLQTLCGDGICSWEEFENLLNPFVNSTIENDFCEL